ncbi:hypothetical protein [Deinococcus sp. PEB2-67]
MTRVRIISALLALAALALAWHAFTQIGPITAPQDAAPALLRALPAWTAALAAFTLATRLRERSGA